MDRPIAGTINGVVLSKDSVLLLVIDGRATYFRITQSALVTLLSSAISHVVTHGGNTDG